MKTRFKMTKLSTALASVAMFATVGGLAQADTFTGAGDGTSWEDPMNWELGFVPGNGSIILDANGPVLNDEGNPQATNTLIGVDFDVEFDADTWAFLQANDSETTRYLQTPTQHRVARLLLGDSTAGATNGTHSLTFDHGDGNEVRVLNGSSAVIGGRPGKFSTLNVMSGLLNIEANRFRVGQGADGSGTVNLTGGTLVSGRGGFELGNPNGGGVSGDATLNITGGLFQSRRSVEIYAAGVFNIVGSTASEIGVGSFGSVDGEWIQSAGGVLSIAFDAGGSSLIFVDDVDDDGAGSQGNVTFEAGAILDLSDLGGATNAVKTVMTWEGTITGAPTLSAASVSAGWTMQIVGNELQVQNPNLPDPPAVEVGDFNGDGVVDCDDLDGYVGNIGATVTPALAPLDFDGNGTIEASDAISVITTLVETSNGQVGTFRGDLNCDGLVNVLGDAFALIGSLGTSVDTYAEGDINFDGMVDVLGDAFILIGNLNESNAP